MQNLRRKGLYCQKPPKKFINNWKDENLNEFKTEKNTSFDNRRCNILFNNCNLSLNAYIPSEIDTFWDFCPNFELLHLDIRALSCIRFEKKRGVSFESRKMGFPKGSRVSANNRLDNFCCSVLYKTNNLEFIDSCRYNHGILNGSVHEKRLQKRVKNLGNFVLMKSKRFSK